MDLFELSDSLNARVENGGPEGLSDAERTFVAIWTLEADVNNGGFDQYFFNSAGDHALLTPKALKAIGADQAAAIVEAANAVFGPAGPSRDRDERQRALEALGDDRTPLFAPIDQRFFAYPDDIQGLLAAYVEAHEEEFRL
jgi:Domain of unknown function (DUF4375)